MTNELDRIGSRLVRHDGWTLERQLGFLEALAVTGNVTNAAAAVGMSFASAYRLRGRAGAEAFRFGWKAAQEMAYFQLRDLAMTRVEAGTDAAIVYHGAITGNRKIFSDRLLVSLLDHLKPDGEAVDKFGARRAAADPGNSFADILDAYAEAIETGFDPIVPLLDTSFTGGERTGDEDNSPIMTREEFIAHIDAMRAKSNQRWRDDCAALPGNVLENDLRFA